MVQSRVEGGGGCWGGGWVGGGWVGGTPYDGLYGEAPPAKGALLIFRLEIYKRLEISRVLKYRKELGKLSLSAVSQVKRLVKVALMQ